MTKTLQNDPTTHQPDRWVVVKIIPTEGTPHYRVFGTWLGGFAGTDWWQMNSGIVRTTREGPWWMFWGRSGSCYRCHQDSWGTTGWSGGILTYIQNASKEIQIITLENQNWLEVCYDE